MCEKKTLYPKYTVAKTSGKPVDPEARYFVLRIDTDPHARVALRAYADSVGASDPGFANDLRVLAAQHDRGEASPVARRSLAEWQALAHGNSRAYGFHEGVLNIGEKLALVHSEVSEALEVSRNESIEELARDLYEDPGGGFHTAQYPFGPDRPCKPVGFPSELADVVIRVMDLAGALGIDLERAIREKHAHNVTRPVKHGRKF